MSELIEDRYEVLKTLGLGSLGRVDLVLDQRTNERRALKRLKTADPETVERLRNEFAALARLRHPHLVSVHDLGRDAAGDPFLTMEFLDGEPLDRAIAPGDVASALRAALEILDGLEFLHANGFAHCDVKPTNVLVLADGSARIIDLGFVGHLGETPGARVRGTPGYLAPEVRKGGAYTRESDLYALGATLYRVLAGRAAFPGRDAAEIVEAQDRGEIALGPLRAMNVPPALDAPLLGLLSLDPRHRVAAARDLRALAQARVARGRKGPDVLHAAGRLLGRDAVVGGLRDAVGGTGAAVVSGRRGAGKSRLALELEVEAELAGRPVVRCDPSSRSFAAPAGALILLEDLDQWSDEALARVELPAEGWFLLVTQRTAPRDGDPVYRLLFRLENPPAPRLVALSPLDADDARRLAEERIGGRLAESIHEHLWTRAGGWPGPLLVELDRMVRAGLIAREGDTWKETGTIDPGSVADADDEGSALLESLSPEARLAGAMIAGCPVGLDNAPSAGLEDLEWAGHLAREDRSFRVVPYALARALRADPRLDRTVREQLAERLRGVTGAAARLALGIHEVMLGRSDAVANLRGAFEGGLREDIRIADEATGHLLSVASTESLLAVARAWRERGDTVRSDQAYATLRAGLPERVDLGLEHAEMLANVMQFGRALNVLDELSNDPDRRGIVLGLHGWCLSRMGKREIGLAEMRTALDLLPESDTHSRAVFHSRLGINLFLDGQVEEGVAHLETSVRDVLSLQDPELEARLHGNQGLRYRLQGQLARAQEENRLALELTRKSGRPEHVPTALANLMSTALDLCDWEAWEQFRILLENTSRQSGNAIAFGRCFEGRTSLGILRGRTRDAARALARVRPWFTRERTEEFYLYAEAQRAVIGSWNGEFDRAIRRLKRVRRRARVLKFSNVEGLASRHLAEILLIRNRLNAARYYAESVLKKRGGDSAVAIPSLLVLARVAHREGRAAVLEEVDVRIQMSDAPTIVPARQEIAAYRALLGGDLESSLRFVASALDVLSRLDLPPRQTLLEWEIGRALQARKHPDAFKYLHHAMEIARRCGMTGWSASIAESIAAAEAPSSDFRSQASAFETKLLPQVIALMNSVVEYRALLHQSLELAAVAIGASRGFILLTGQSELELTAVAQYGGVDDSTRASAIDVSRTIVRRVTESGVPFIAGDVGSDPRLGSTQSLLDMAVRSLICVPLQTKSGIIGTIYLESSTSGAQFTTADLDLVESFAGLISVAIESGRLHDELKRSRERIVGQNLALRRDVSRRFSKATIIGQSPEIVGVVSDAERVAVARSNVLITGETGTGKELIAKLIHYSSPRADQVFVPLNCAAFPADLIESELFGIADRVATNVRARPGIFEQASGGTLFLDEIGELSPMVQVKLLRVLQEREFAPIGSGKLRPVDFRLISATNQDLQDLMDRGLFRADLYHRIHTLRIHIPPLRERKIDILLLANHFLEKFCEENGRPLPTISSQLKSVLLQSGWPGNVRELQNYIERLAVMCQGPVLETAFVPSDMEKRPGSSARKLTSSIDLPNGNSSDSSTHRSAVEDFERARIARALEESGGNQRRAADLLGLKESTFRYMLKKLELKPEGRTSRSKKRR